MHGDEILEDLIQKPPDKYEVFFSNIQGLFYKIHIGGGNNKANYHLLVYHTNKKIRSVQLYKADDKPSDMYLFYCVNLANVLLKEYTKIEGILEILNLIKENGTQLGYYLENQQDVGDLTFRSFEKLIAYCLNDAKQKLLLLGA